MRKTTALTLIFALWLGSTGSPASAKNDLPAIETKAGMETKHDAQVPITDILTRGAAYFEKRISSDNPEAALLAGYALITSGQTGRGFKYLQQAAEHDSDLVDAWYYMGHSYATGLAPNGQDLEAARHWFTKAAEKGHIASANQLYFFELLGLGGPADHEQAFKRAQQLAHHNDPVALNNLGVMYEFGIGTPKAPDTALEWYLRAAQHDSAAGHFNLARRYESQDTPKSDLESVKKHYLISAELGFAPAQYRVGIMMRDGIGFHKDSVTALDWLQRSGLQANVEAMYVVGTMLEEGIGTSVNLFEAQKWYRSAIEMGHAPSAIRMGNIASGGIANNQELRKAYSWYHLALKLAETDDLRNKASELRDKTAEALTEDEKKAAREHAEMMFKEIYPPKDEFATLAKGVSSDMFANPIVPDSFSSALVDRAIQGGTETKN